MGSRLLVICFAFELVCVQGFSSVIGTNPPALPLTLERIANLPREKQGAWRTYLKHSARQSELDQQFFQKELRKYKVTELIVPPESHSARGIPLDKPVGWYAQPEALRIADIVVSFQTPAGGWSKNLDMTKHRRAPGERFSTDNVSRFPVSGDNDAPRERSWNYVGTFDNDATVTQLRYLAKVIRGSHETQSAAVADGTATLRLRSTSEAYRSAFLRGLDYIFAAQYPNGGWPQVWPLQGGYHDAITYNDGAMIQVLELLRDVAAGRNEFAFVPQKVRMRATESVKSGVRCILATQIVTHGERTIWCQQHDALTLRPCSARNYEMPSESSAESAGIMLFLMEEPKPSAETIAAVNAAAAWFEKTKIRDRAYRSVAGSGRMLVEAPGNGPIWARYYDIESNLPVFGDRDKTIHDNVNEISTERRNGYAWYRDTPLKAMARYAAWRENILRAVEHF